MSQSTYQTLAEEFANVTDMCKGLGANSQKRDAERAHAHPERSVRSHWSVSMAQYIMVYLYYYNYIYVGGFKLYNLTYIFYSDEIAVTAT